jgi:hypothetical protein
MDKKYYDEVQKLKKAHKKNTFFRTKEGRLSLVFIAVISAFTAVLIVIDKFIPGLTIYYLIACAFILFGYLKWLYYRVKGEPIPEREGYDFNSSYADPAFDPGHALYEIGKTSEDED